MTSELDELWERIAKLPESDRYLLAEMILTDIRTQSDAQRLEYQQAMLEDYNAMLAEETKKRGKKRAAR